MSLIYDVFYDYVNGNLNDDNLNLIGSTITSVRAAAFAYFSNITTISFP